MKSLLINTELPEERRIILVEDGLVTDYETELEGQVSQKGNIYRATIERVETSLEAAFVDLPGDRNGFLPFREIAPEYLRPADGDKPVGERIAAGDKLLVQVTKEKRDNKGAALTTHISLAGCYLVLRPTLKGKTQITRNIAHEDRGDTQAMLNGIIGDRDMSVILRTAGLDCTPEDLRWDFEGYLLKLWGLIRDAYAQQSRNTLIYAENNLLQKAIREYLRADVDEVVCDTPSVHAELKGLVELMMPEFADRVRFHEGPSPLVRLGTERQIRAVHSRMVGLPSGGKIVFDSTEALVAIDVNSAQSTKESGIEETARKTNIEAATEIARQLKLRDLGGLIIVDFIDMDSKPARDQVEQHFRRELKRDRARIRVVGISELGLLQLSRQRIRQSVDLSYQTQCTRCHGTGRIQTVQATSIEIIRAVRESALSPDTDALVVTCPVDVQTNLLNEKRIELRRLEDLHNVSITVVPDLNLQTPNHHIKTLSREKKRDAHLFGKLSYQMNDRQKDEPLHDYLDNLPQVVPSARPVVEQVTPGKRDAANGGPRPGPDSPKEKGLLGKIVGMLFGPPQPAAGASRPAGGAARSGQGTEPQEQKSKKRSSRSRRRGSGRKRQEEGDGPDAEAPAGGTPPEKQAAPGREDAKAKGQEDAKPKSRRSRRGGRKSSGEGAAAGQQKAEARQGGDAPTKAPGNGRDRPGQPARQEPKEAPPRPAEPSPRPPADKPAGRGASGDDTAPPKKESPDRAAGDAPRQVETKGPPEEKGPRPDRQETRGERKPAETAAADPGRGGPRPGDGPAAREAKDPGRSPDTPAPGRAETGALGK